MWQHQDRENKNKNKIKKIVWGASNFEKSNLSLLSGLSYLILGTSYMYINKAQQLINKNL